MSGFRSILKVVFLLALAALVVPLSACGQKVVHSNVKPGDMPPGATWTGVYYSEIYGYLHLIKEGDTVNGRWRTTDGAEWGELTGKVDGNLLRYSWKNHKIGMVGPSASTSGKGYFVYSRPHKGEADEIHGQWGLQDSDSGSKWDCVKQKGMKPNFKSVLPDEYQRRGVGGGWDQSSGGGSKAGSGDNGGDDQGAAGSSGDSDNPSGDPLNNNGDGL